MNLFGKAIACMDCGVEPVAFPGSTCPPCTAKRDEEECGLRKREIEALERCAAALERIAGKGRSRVMAFEKHEAEKARQRARSKPKAR